MATTTTGDAAAGAPPGGLKIRCGVDLLLTRTGSDEGVSPFDVTSISTVGDLAKALVAQEKKESEVNFEGSAAARPVVMLCPSGELLTDDTVVNETPDLFNDDVWCVLTHHPKHLADRTLSVLSGTDDMRMAMYNLKHQLQNAQYAEEFIDGCGIELVLDNMGEWPGSVQAHAMAGLRVALGYVSGMETIMERDNIERMFALVESPSLPVIRNTLELVFCVASISDEGNRHVRKAIKAQDGYDERIPLGPVLKLLAHGDMDVQMNALTLMNVILQKASKFKVARYKQKWDRFGILEMLMEATVNEDEKFQLQLTEFQSLTKIRIPGSWFDLQQWKDKYQELTMLYEEMEEQMYKYRLQQNLIDVLKSELFQTRKLVKTYQDQGVIPTSRANETRASKRTVGDEREEIVDLSVVEEQRQEQLAAEAEDIAAEKAVVVKEVIKEVQVVKEVKVVDEAAKAELEAAQKQLAADREQLAAELKKLEEDKAAVAAKLASADAQVEAAEKKTEQAEAAEAEKKVAEEKKSDEAAAVAAAPLTVAEPDAGEEAVKPAAVEVVKEVKVVDEEAKAALESAQKQLAADREQLEADRKKLAEEKAAFEASKAKGEAEAEKKADGDAPATAAPGGPAPPPPGPAPNVQTGGGPPPPGPAPNVQTGGGGPPPPPPGPAPGSGGGGPPPPPPGPAPGSGGGGPPPPPPPPGGGPPPPPGGGPPPPPGSGPPGAPGGAPGLNIPRPSKPKVQPEAKMKQLFWTRILKAPDQKTVWDNVEEVEFDASKFAAMFAAKAPAKPKKKEPTEEEKKKAANRPVQVLDQKRSHQLGIMLSRLPAPTIVREAIMTLDDNKLDREQLESIMGNLPTPEELVAVKAAAGPNVNLDKPEKFYLMLATIPQLGPRLKVWGFLRDFDDQAKPLTKNLDTIRSAAKELTKNDVLPKVLGVVLSFGNYMNGGTAKGQADGFQIDLLPKLADTKDVENKTTLLQHVVEFLAEKHPGTLKFPTTVPNVRQAVRLSLEQYGNDVKRLGLRLKESQRMAEGVIKAAKDGDSPGKDEFVKAVPSALADIEEQLEAVTSQFDEVKTDFVACVEFFGMPPGRARDQKTEAFFTIWRNFAVNFEKFLPKEKEATGRPGRKSVAAGSKRTHAMGAKIGGGGSGADPMAAIINSLKAGGGGLKKREWNKEKGDKKDGDDATQAPAIGPGMLKKRAPADA